MNGVAVTTVGAAAAAAAAELAQAGIEGASREARLLLAHALGAEAGGVLMARDRELSAAEGAAFAALVARRAAREPLSHITGRREFWSLEFGVGPAVLDPRPDSEALVEAALGCIAARAAPLRLLDLGTGSGCLLLALLSELPNARGVGVDRSAAALAVARANAAALGLAARAAFVQGDWATALSGAFDLIVCNPPYIATAAIGALMPEVARHEPRLALDGGADGLDAYRRLAPDIARLLAVGGIALVEVGLGQGDAAAAIFAAAGLSDHARRRDLAGRERALLLGRAAARG
jgi:release factor glutamine methyltransferase